MIEVCQSLIREHRQMEALLAELGLRLDGLPEDSAGFSQLLQHIAEEINIHFACEENALFPAVSPYHPMVLMEAEHEMLIALRDELLGLSRMEGPATAEIRVVGERFIHEMLDHIAREDGGIFPMCEQSLSEVQKEAVLAAMATIRQDALHSPTPSIERESRGVQVFHLDLGAPADRPLFSRRLSAQPEIKHLVVRGGDQLPGHWAPRRITIVCLGGQGTLTTADIKVNLQPGAGAVISARLQHAIAAETDCHLLLFYD